MSNKIERDFHADKPNKKWLTDITEFALPAGTAYLSAFESEVQAMCNLGQGLVNYTVDKTMVNNIIALMTNLKKTVQEAMALLNVPEEKRNQYAQAVEEVKRETEQK